MTERSSRSRPLATAPCGCRRCRCISAPACRCHVFNALVALALWDLRRPARRSAP